MKKYKTKISAVFLTVLLLFIFNLQSDLFFSSVDAEPSGKFWTPESGRAPEPGDKYYNPDDGSVLVWIPGGSFIMGSEEGDEDEKPPHRVKVDGFWLAKYPVTNRQYAAFLEETFRSEPGYWDDPDFNVPEKPVTAITYYEALAYCEWAGVRLPTEAEWEYVASGGGQFKYPTNNGKISHDQANIWGTGGRDSWLETPSPVGVFPPNPYGLYDMAGSVFEWTSSLYMRYPYNPEDGRESSSAGYHRVMRGGAWQFGPYYARTAYRHDFAMHLRYDYAGMRVAKTAFH